MDVKLFTDGHTPEAMVELKMIDGAFYYCRVKNIYSVENTPFIRINDDLSDERIVNSKYIITINIREGA